MTTTIDTENLVELIDIRCADDDGCGITVYWDPRVAEYVAVGIETGELVTHTQSATAVVVHTAAALISYETDGVTGYGPWTATVKQGHEMLADVAALAHDIETLAADR